MGFVIYISPFRRKKTVKKSFTFDEEKAKKMDKIFNRPGVSIDKFTQSVIINAMFDYVLDACIEEIEKGGKPFRFKEIEL